MFLFRTVLSLQDSYWRDKNRPCHPFHTGRVAELLLMRLLAGVGGPVLELGDDFVEHLLDVLL
jgi:hypothetical protein